MAVDLSDLVELLQAEVTTKTCSSCNVSLDSTSFYKNSSGKFGLDSKCKMCRKKASAAYQAARPQRYGPMHMRSTLSTSCGFEQCDNRSRVGYGGFCSQKCKSLKNSLVTLGERSCGYCGELIELLDHINRIYCSKSCANKSQHLMKAYGLTSTDLENLLQKAGYKCQICGEKFRDDSTQRNLYVDHDHNSGEIRGLLCRSCNTGLGMLKDSCTLLRKALIYLEGQENGY